MKFSAAASLALTAALAKLTAASGFVGLYDQQYAKGNSVSFAIDDGVCVNFPSGWNDRARSLVIGGGSDNHTVCVFFTESGCTGDYHDYQVPIVLQVNQIPAQFDKQYNSVGCISN